MAMKKISTIGFLMLFVLLSYQGLNAQFYKVYDYQPAEAGEIEFSLWNSWIPSSDKQHPFFGEDLSRDGLLAHSLELEYGLSNRFGVALYFDFEDPVGDGLKYVRTKGILAHYAFFDKGSRPVDIAVYLEYKIPRKSYKDYEEFEFRLILEKDIGVVRIDCNPIFEKKMSGSKVDEGVELNYALGIYYWNGDAGIYQNKSLMIQPGIEFYGKFGEISRFKSFQDQQHYIFPTVDLFIGPRIHWHTGIGFGLTQASDNVTIKSILSIVLKF
jgi:hypothetical protein